MKIGVIGTGTIATEVVRGIATDNHQIMVSQRSKANATMLAAEFSNVTIGDNQMVVDNSEVVFLGLMAEVAESVLSELTFRPEQRIITLMAGATLAEANALVAPAQAVALMLPFPAIAKGGSPIMMQGDAALVGEIFAAKNTLFVLNSDSEMAAYLSAQAVLSPVARMVDDAAKWLGERVDNAEQGEEFLRKLVTSSLADSTCADLITALNTPGGYNQRLRVHMEESGMTKQLHAGLDELEKL